MDSKGDEALAALRDAVAAKEGTCEGRAETAAAIPDTRLATTEAGRLQALQAARLAMALAGRTIGACARAKDDKARRAPRVSLLFCRSAVERP
jgi:hypothetical protein